MHAGKGCDGMTGQNICKFIAPNEAKELSATNFVYETRAAQAHKSTLLPVHRVHVVSDGEGVYISLIHASGILHPFRRNGAKALEGHLVQITDHVDAPKKSE